MAKKMLIDATHPEETRVVVVDGNRVEEFDYETVTKAQISGNIYLAKVTRVEPSLQAAFVDYGGGRHGFLAFNEIHPDYYQIPVADREALLEAERQAAQREAEEEELAAERANDRRDDDDDKGRRRKNGRGRGRGDKRDKREPGNGQGAAAAGRSRRNRRGLKPANDLTEAELPDRLLERIASGATPLAAIALPDVDLSSLEDAATPAQEAAQVGADATPTPDFSDVESIEILQTVEDENGEVHTERTTLSGGAVVTERVGALRDETVTGEAPQADEESTQDESAEAVVAQEVSEESAAEDVSADASDVDTDPDADDDSDDEADEDGSDATARESDDGDDEDDDDADDAEESQVEEVGAVDAREEIRPRKARLRDYKIQEVIKRRQIMLVQVVKEERGNKGAALTTYLSLAGRYCVLMPNTARGGGISRKITNAADRKRLKAAAAELDVPEGMGLIIRTAGANRTKAEIKRDYEYLLRQWSSIRDLTLRSIAPTLIYEEGSLIKRAIRDLYSKDIDAILVEGDEGYREARDYMQMLMPSHTRHVQYYREPTPLFIRYQVESQMSAMMQPVVQLKSGGYLVIGVTEALVAIDVNSGKSTKESSIEETALKTNLEAADEVARQMRLRDLAGLIVIDFIDMEESKNDRSVEKRLKDALKTDRARIQVGRISAFGLLEMSRQRLRPGLLEATTVTCPHCKGAGVIRSEESLALSVLRAIEEEALKGKSPALKALAPIPVANYILNHKRARLGLIEERHDLQVYVEGDPLLISPDFRIEKTKAMAREEPARSAAVQMDAGLLGDDIDEAEILEDEIEDIEENTEPSNREARGRDTDSSDDDESGERKRRGRRGGRRRKRGGDDEGGDPLPVIDFDDEDESASTEADADASETTADAESDDARAPKRRRSRSRRGGRNRSGDGETGDSRNGASGEQRDDNGETDDARRAETVAEAATDEADAEASGAEASTVETSSADAGDSGPAEEAAPARQAAASGPRLFEVTLSDDEPGSDASASETGAETLATEAPMADEAAEDVAVQMEPAARQEPETVAEPAKRSEPDKPRRTGWWAFRRGA